MSDAASHAVTGTTASRFSVGLTGGIGCGKSTVADLFGARGACVIDTDLIAHALTAPGGEAMPALLDRFGAECATPDGALDRARMRALVFSDPASKASLEQILHPRIRARAEQDAAAAHAPYLLFVVPLLFEAGTWRARVNRVLVVDCPESQQIARVIARSRMSKQQAQAIMSTQVPRAVRLAGADDIIVNQTEIAALIPQIDRLHSQYLDFSERMTTNGSQDL